MCGGQSVGVWLALTCAELLAGAREEKHDVPPRDVYAHYMLFHEEPEEKKWFSICRVVTDRRHASARLHQPSASRHLE